MEKLTNDEEKIYELLHQLDFYIEKYENKKWNYSNITKERIKKIKKIVDDIKQTSSRDKQLFRFGDLINIITNIDFFDLIRFIRCPKNQSLNGNEECIHDRLCCQKIFKEIFDIISQHLYFIDKKYFEQVYSKNKIDIEKSLNYIKRQINGFDARDFVLEF